MEIDSNILKIINQLHRENSTDNCFNQYSEFDNRQNLQTYLSYYKKFNPKILLVGEAVGYKGCRLTGIPFTSPTTIKESRAKFFRINRGNLKIQTVVREASASAVWEVLELTDAQVLLWNIFPFHPHRQNLPLSNRRPSNLEIESGIKFLIQILQIFDPSILVAVGRVSEKAMNRYIGPSACVYVRHPSHGGKKQFQSQVRKILGIG